MNIALMSHDNKKDLMVQFCTAYAGILSQHQLYATNTTGHMVADATGLDIHCFFSCAHGGAQQIGGEVNYITRLCDRNNIPYASNIATAEMLVLGLARGDLDYRSSMNPSSGPIV